MTNFTINGKTVADQSIQDILNKLSANNDLSHYHDGDTNFTSTELGRILDQFQPAKDEINKQDLAFLEESGILSRKEAADLIFYYANSQPSAEKWQVQPQVQWAFSDSIPMGRDPIEDAYLRFDSEFEFPVAKVELSIGTKAIQSLVESLIRYGLEESESSNSHIYWGMSAFHENTRTFVDKPEQFQFKVAERKEYKTFFKNGNPKTFLVKSETFTFNRYLVPNYNVETDPSEIPPSNSVVTQYHFVEYEYDEFGNPIKVTFDRNQDRTAECTFTFKYDESDRLTERVFISENGAVVMRESWQYDATSGRLLSHTLDRNSDGKIDRKIDYRYDNSGWPREVESVLYKRFKYQVGSQQLDYQRLSADVLTYTVKPNKQIQETKAELQETKDENGRVSTATWQDENENTVVVKFVYEGENQHISKKITTTFNESPERKFRFVKTENFNPKTAELLSFEEVRFSDNEKVRTKDVAQYY